MPMPRQVRQQPGIDTRRVQNGDISRFAGGCVDLVNTDTLFSDGSEVRRCCDILGGDPGATDENVLRALAPVGKLVWTVTAYGVEVGLTEIENIGVEVVQEVDRWLGPRARTLVMIRHSRRGHCFVD